MCLLVWYTPWYTVFQSVWCSRLDANSKLNPFQTFSLIVLGRPIERIIWHFVSDRSVTALVMKHPARRVRLRGVALRCSFPAHLPCSPSAPSGSLETYLPKTGCSQ